MRFKVLTLAVVLLAAVSVASATTDTLTLVNGGSDVMGGVYVGPYNFTGSGGLSGSLQLVCDDFSDEVYVGESWNVTTTPQLSSLSYADHLGTPTVVQEEEIAWLAEALFANADLGNAENVGDIQWAIWDIFTPTASSSDPYGTISATDLAYISTWLASAAKPSNYATGNYSNLLFYTPVSGSQVPSGDGPPQQYIDPGIKPKVPEPGVLLLVAIGLCSMVAFRRRFELV